MRNLIYLLIPLTHASLAFASIITFDDPVTAGLVESSRGGNYANFFRDVDYNGSSSYSVGGFTFSVNNGQFYLDNGGDNVIRGDGSNMLNFTQYNSVNPVSFLTITKTGGGLFDLYSFDAVISYYNDNSAETIKVNNEPITITQSIQTFAIDAKSVSQVTISSIATGQYFAIDNVNSVPEPSTGLLVVLGLGAVLLKRRKTGTL
jgi:hypothetical protein